MFKCLELSHSVGRADVLTPLEAEQQWFHSSSVISGKTAGILESYTTEMLAGCKTYFSHISIATEKISWNRV